jgi:hypothetical protein
MPPEQANAEWDRVDARADAFGLGGLLCAILTGQPPFAGGPDQARRADLAEARARLDGCGADAELVGLAKACLSPEVEDRPRDAGEVARRVGEYRRAHQAQVGLVDQGGRRQGLPGRQPAGQRGGQAAQLRVDEGQ